MTREFTALYKRSGKWITAWVMEVPAAMTQGRTMKETRDNLSDALKLVLQEQNKYAKQQRLYKRESFAVTV